MKYKFFKVVLGLSSILLVFDNSRVLSSSIDKSISAYWSIREESGYSIFDYSGNKNNIKLYNTDWIKSDKRIALKFVPQTKSYGEAFNSPNLNLNGMFTIDLYIKTYGSTGAWQTIIAKRDDKNILEKVQYQLSLNKDLQLFFIICIGADYWWLPKTDIFLKPNQWYHIVATYNSFLRKVDIYVDGTLQKTLERAPRIQASDNPIKIGWSGWEDEFFYGEIGEIRIINSLVEKITALQKNGIKHCVVISGPNYFAHQFVVSEDKLSGTLEATVLNPLANKSQVLMQIEIGKKKFQKIKNIPAVGTAYFTYGIPESLSDTQAQVKLIENGVTISFNTVSISSTKEIKGYQGYIVTHTHSDLCWPDTPEVCMNANVAAIAKSVEIAEKFPNYRFTMEHGLFLREYLNRNPDKKDIVKQLMQKGVIETGAFYTGPWELTCGGEGLVRELYLGKLWIKKNLGVEPVTVWNVDVAGHTMQMPQILKKAGIKGLVISAGATDNTFDAPYILHETQGPFLFNWEAPDGSIMPTWSTPWGYGSAGALGLRSDRLDQFINSLPEFLSDVRKNHTAHSLPKIAFITDGTDIQSPTAQVAENIQKWNTKNRFPRLIHASSAELFNAIHQESLPTYAGEMPSPWDLVQAEGNDCLLLDRQLEGRLLAAEKFATFANIVSPNFIYPKEQFEKIWENRLFTLEHNWGGTNGSISIQEKTNKIREANKINEIILQNTFQSLANAIKFKFKDAIRILVFNPLSWDRKDIVACSFLIPPSKVSGLAIIDTMGNSIPYQIVNQDSDEFKSGKIQIVFCTDVPSLGYSTYYALLDRKQPESVSPLVVDPNKNIFENAFYRLVLDGKTGGIKSILDKRNNQELVKQNSKFTLNELLALEDSDNDTGTHFTGKQWLMREYPSTFQIVENGSVRLVIAVEGMFIDNSHRKQEIILYRDLDRIDLITTIDWKGKKNIHLYQVYPFNIAEPKVKYAVPYAWEQYGNEMKYAAPWPFGPVAGYNSRGVRGWIELSEDTNKITLASDCNFAAFKDLTANPEPGFLMQPMLLRTVRSCGDPHLFYTQPGQHTFRFSLQPQADAVRFGEEHNSPLLSYVVRSMQLDSTFLPDKLSFAQIQPGNVQIAAVKQAEDGQGMMVRLIETGKSKNPETDIEINLFKPIIRAMKTNIIEENEKDIPIKNGTVSISTAPFGIETMRLFVKSD